MRSLAERLNAMLFDEVICGHYLLSHGAVAQLAHDMSALFTLFRHYWQQQNKRLGL